MSKAKTSKIEFVKLRKSKMKYDFNKLKKDYLSESDIALTKYDNLNDLILDISDIEKKEDIKAHQRNYITRFSMTAGIEVGRDANTNKIVLRKCNVVSYEDCKANRVDTINTVKKTEKKTKM